jgi:excinuclease ABC subunit C
MTDFLINPQIIANLPSDPGIYKMLDTEGKVLYVGKASNLKKRVSSYFLKTNISPKTRSLVNQIADIEISITRSETEALLLESNLIKLLRPKYNILMRDDKSYPYIQVNTHHPYPRMDLYRSKKKPKKGTYFGPYPSATAVRETLNTIQKVFKIRNCRDSFFSTRSRPCLQYQIKRCSAPCTRYISEKDYQQSLNDAIRFLQGKSQQILSDLTKRMEAAVQVLAFEQAVVLRDQIKNLRLIQEQQAVVQLRGDADVVAMKVEPDFACVQCVTIREGQVIANQSFFPTMPAHYFSDQTMESLRQQVFEAFISHYYLDNPERIPSIIILDHPFSDMHIIEEMLRTLANKKCKIQIKPRGIKLRWLDFAINNLKLTVAEHTASSQLLSKRYTALTELLELSTPIARMECFDISHTQGNQTVASCVVFDKNGPSNAEYRQFNIKDITPGDDYAAMEQAVYRRFKKLLEIGSLPELLIIDGGKGQISVAIHALEYLGIYSVTVLGIAKGPDRKAGLERIILPDREIALSSDSLALHLLQHIRDEAHRFAITAHRKKRQKASIGSTLLSIEGIGPKRRQALLNRFGGLRELYKAPKEEIEKVAGISVELAARIFDHIQSQK